MKKFNINDYFYIQITDLGWEHLKQTVGEDYIKYCINSRAVEINGETWHRLQCHNVFELFPLHVGQRLLFNTNILLDDNELINLDAK